MTVASCAKNRLPAGRVQECPLQILRHGAIHSVHHRGQVSLLCRMLGHAPGNYDAVFYYAGDVILH